MGQSANGVNEMGSVAESIFGELCCYQSFCVFELVVLVRAMLLPSSSAIAFPHF